MCVPVTRHYKCRSCRSYFSKTIGDCVGPLDLILRCPYCSKAEIELVQESVIKESFSIIKNRFKKVLK